MIGVHSPELIRTRQHSHPRKEYLEDLLNGLTEAKQQGLSLEQVKDEFSFNKRYARFQKTFTLQQNLNEKHQDNIEKIWHCLHQED